MEQERILIERKTRIIDAMSAFLKMKCRIANLSLQRIKKEVSPNLNVTSDIAMEIAKGKTTSILAAMRSRLEAEAKSKIEIVRESQINQSLKIIEEKLNAIFSNSEAIGKKENNYLFGYSVTSQDWSKYIVFDGNEVSFDESAVVEDNSTFITPESAEYSYLKKAEQLCKEISEFILLTQQLGYSKAISSDEDSVIYIAKRKQVQLDTKKIVWLDFSSYGAALESAQSKSHFEKENVNH